MTSGPYAIIENGRSGQTLRFHDPVALFIAREPDDIAPAFAAMEAARRSGLSEWPQPCRTLAFTCGLLEGLDLE